MSSAAQLKATLERHLSKDSQARVWAIRVDDVPPKPENSLHVGNRMFRVSAARSVLGFRELLANLPVGTDLLIVTDLDERELGDDVLVRLGKQRLLSAARWEAVLDRYSATHIDPRLRAAKELAEPLLRAEPSGGFYPAPQGVLTAEHAWDDLCRAYLGWAGLPPTEIDAYEAIITTPPQLSGVLERNAKEFLVAKFGGDLGHLWAHVQSQGNSSAIAIGLVFDLLEPAPSEERTTDLDLARARLEGHLGRRLGRAGRLAWAEAGLRCYARADSQSRSTIERQVQLSVQQIAAEPFLARSHSLPDAFDQRLIEYCESLGERDTLGASQALRALWSHRLGPEQPRRLARAQAALRALRLLLAPPPIPASLRLLCQVYSDHFAYADRLREALSFQDELKAVNQAHAMLLKDLDGLRVRFDEVFLKTLAANSELGADVLPSEEFLERTLLPLARVSRVLLVVLDGARWTDATKFAESLRSLGWRELDLDQQGPLLSPLPSVTHLARHSLLTGRLAVGNQSDEKKAFVAHPLLREACDTGYPPVLFHKASVRESIDEELSTRVEEDRRQIVGVVINALDDLLGKGGQLEPLSDVAQIRPLHELILQASKKELTLVLVSDHGHVRDRAGTGWQVPGGVSAGGRWRRPAGQPRDGEIELSGPRVLHPDTGTPEPLVFLTGEHDHYGSRAAGYHGGAHPVEVLPPLLAFSRGPTPPEGYSWRPPREPLWWMEEGVTSAAGDGKHQTLIFKGDHEGLAVRLTTSHFLQSRARPEERSLVGRILKALEGYESLPLRRLASDCHIDEVTLREFLPRLSAILTAGQGPLVYADGDFVKTDWVAIVAALRVEG